MSNQCVYFSNHRVALHAVLQITILMPVLQDMTKDDLYFDEPLLRRIRRAEQAEREQEEGSSDLEEEEEQENETVNAPIKGEAVMADDG